MLQQTLALGTIARVPIRLHWSWGLLVVLLSASLSPVYAAGACGGAAACAGSWGLALLMALLVSGSVLLHELGHALVARRCAVPVEGITLFAFGGIAEVQVETPGPGQELAIAIAGPAVSLAIAGGAGLLWLALGWLAEALGRDLRALADLARHLALANGIMALFNLLPGYPMDGGRVLRATLWFLNDELLPATRAAALIGRLVASAIALGGLLAAALWGQPLLALWGLLIGFFLHSTARTGYRQLLVQTALHGVRVGELMQLRVRATTADLTLEEFVGRFLFGQSELGFPVIQPAAGETAPPRLIGLMTLRALRRVRSSEWGRVRVGAAMLTIAPLSPETSALDALHRMNRLCEELLPVAEAGRLVGVLSRRDLAIYVQVQLARSGG